MWQCILHPKGARLTVIARKMFTNHQQHCHSIISPSITEFIDNFREEVTGMKQ
jgi:hypothetical protein